MKRTDLISRVVLLLVFSSLYFATASGITCSNDGSHYALTRALAEEGRFTIESYDEYAEGNDIARREGKLFSDRPPGTALLASGFYKLGTWLPAPMVELPSRHDLGNSRLPYVMLVPVLAGSGTVVLLHLLLRELSVSVFSALTTCVIFGLGTIHWKYSSVLFSHAPAALLVLLAVYLVIRASRTPAPHPMLLLALGFIVGFAVLVEYSNAIVVAAIGLYLFLAVRPLPSTHQLVPVALYVAGGLAPVSFLAFYNATNFGGPLALSYHYAVNYPWAGQLTETFSFPLDRGLIAMLIWGEGGGWCNPTCYNQGVFLLSPVLLLSLLGIRSYIRRARSESVLTLGLFLTYLGLFAKHRTFHGFTADGRYLAPFLALWCIPIAFYVDGTLGRGRDPSSTERPAPMEHPAWQAAGQLALYGAFFLSLRNIFLHIGFSYNYKLDLGRLSTPIAQPQNWFYLLSRVFPNAGNLPLLWMCEGVVLALALVAWRVRRQWVRMR